ncbi:MAG: hypothetical protein RLZZ238_2014, partial [Planctomycetota bacterium]
MVHWIVDRWSARDHVEITEGNATHPLNTLRSLTSSKSLERPGWMSSSPG